MSSVDKFDSRKNRASKKARQDETEEGKMNNRNLKYYEIDEEYEDDYLEDEDYYPCYDDEEEYEEEY